MKVQHKLASGPLRRQGETLTDRQVLPMPHSAGGRGTPCALGREDAASPEASLFSERPLLEKWSLPKKKNAFRNETHPFRAM